MKKIIYLIALFTTVRLGFAQDLKFEQPKVMSNIASGNFEYSKPILSPDGTKMYYVQVSLEKKNRVQNIVAASYSEQEWTNLGEQVALNNNYPNAVCGISLNGKTIYLSGSYSRKGNPNPGISFTTLNNNTYGEIKDTKIPSFSFFGEYIDYFVSADGNVLIVSIFGKDSYGQQDLYACPKMGDGSWGTPINMGTNVNSSGYEIAPYLTPDNKILFFSSNGHPGEGDADIFMVQRLDNSWVNWSAPINLGKEVNSSGFDAYFSVGNDQTAYFSSNRSGGLSKLYSVKYEGELGTPVTQLAQKNQPKSDCGDPCEEIAKLRELIEQQRAEYSKHEFAAEGKVAIPKPVFIFFELNSTNIAKDFEQDLEFVANFLKANPSFAITLTGHADKRGNRKINEQISAKRANACKDFIVKKGIEPRRITMSSYGADREINEKIFIDEAQNRRVEIHFNKLDVN